MQTKVFLAEDALLAFIDRAHAKHLHAGAFFRYFAQEHCFLFTNISIVSATYQKISEVINFAVAKDFIKALTFSNIAVLSPEIVEINTAMKVVVGTSDMSFQESLMLTMAEKRGIHEVCTFSQLHQLFGIKTFFLPV
ncbi:MAG TPA: hypothetical protein VLB73_03640 [Patescibacteria group bacterium]|nr:hypothetical protein [Patescibacteria group bacterium]